MKKLFITGLVILLPLAFTIWLFLFLINLLTKPFMNFFQSWLASIPAFAKGFLILSQEQTLRFFSQTLILVSLLAITFLLGFLTRWVVVHSVLDTADRLLRKIPLVNKIYRTAKEVVSTLMTPGSAAFKQVVIVPFPQPGSHCLGLVTSRDEKEKSDDSLVTVFVPATPNPTMGYLIVYRHDQISFLDMTVEEALKVIVSCGLTLAK